MYMLKSIKRFLKSCRYWSEYFLVVAFYYSCRMVSLERSSLLAGKFAMYVGPKLGISNVARRHLAMFLPEQASEHEAIVKGMWENLGRTFGEYPHLSSMNIMDEASPVQVGGKEVLEEIRSQGRSIIFFLGHIANWEYATMPAKAWGFNISQLYRPLNNPPLARFITNVHSQIASKLVTKGHQGARDMIDVLKKGEHLSMLIDQKFNEGIAVDFFGKPAMTAPALAKLAIKFNCAIVPVQVIRTKKHFCEVIYHRPLEIRDDLDDQEKVMHIMQQVNGCLEQWIGDNPKDWLWLHKRWPK
jgi:KDO2-lipid IV(A) lauroyltransferase